MENATAVFAVTDFWGPVRDPANHAKLKPGQTINEWGYHNELHQATNIIDAVAKTASLKRFIWSGLSAAKKWSKGKYNWVYHFDSKADATEHIKRTHPALLRLTSVVQIGAYLSNHYVFPGLIPRRAGDGAYVMTFPPTNGAMWPYIAAEVDTGLFVRALVVEVAADKNLMAYRERLSPKNFLSIWSAVNKVKCRYIETPFDGFFKAGNDARELAETAACVAECGYEGVADPTLCYPKDVSEVHVCIFNLFILTCPLHTEEWIRQQDWTSVRKE